MSVAHLMLRVLALGVEHGVSYPREMMLVARALVAAEGSAQAADPSLDVTRLALGAAGTVPERLGESALSLGRGMLETRGDVLEAMPLGGRSTRSSWPRECGPSASWR
jgi:predicted unusual protein kinase regulating ubiquinone biosynthesis (AarF/ABC1/UbiB family)